MSTAIRMVAVMIAFLGCLAAFAWSLARTAGYGLGVTLLTSLGVYVGTLLLYAGARRIMNRRRSRHARASQKSIPLG
jgi:Mn2+/Fe2+ NRAMP family transporter